MTTNTTPTADSVLMGGGGAPAGKVDIGQPIHGRITQISAPYQEREYSKENPGQGELKFFKNGNPILTFYVDLATDLRDPAIEDDDGTRRVYMDGSRIKKAVRAAVQAAGAQGLTVGSYLAITCTHYDEPNDRRSGKNYQVQYTPGAPANSVLMGDPNTGEVTPQQVAQQAQQYAPQQPVQQYQQQPAQRDPWTGQPVQQAPTWTQPQQPQQAAPQQQYTPPPPPAPAQPPAAAPAQPPAPAGPTPEQIAALRATGLDPATVYPGWQG